MCICPISLEKLDVDTCLEVRELQHFNLKKVIIMLRVFMSIFEVIFGLSLFWAKDFNQFFDSSWGFGRDMIRANKRLRSDRDQSWLS